MSDSDSSSSSDSEVDNQQVVDLLASLQKSPYYYEGHLQLIKVLRQQGDLDRAREARNNMRNIFPLTEALWLEWVRDEIPLTGLIAESALELRLLFEAAIEDYLSVKIWLEFAQFAVDKMSLMPEGVEFPRDVFERGVVACGLHVSQSRLLWDSYLEFEKAILQSLQDMQLENLEDEDLKQQVEAQFLGVDKLYKRRLAVAHIGMEEAFQEYAGFSEAAITEDSLPAYTRAKKQLEQYLPFETQLANSDPPAVEDYRSYLDHLSSTKADPLLLNTLHKRAVAHHCLDSDLWLEYLQFLDKNFRTAPAVLLPGYRLAIRNCTWECRFWLGLLRGLERTHSNHEEIIVTFEKALGDNFSSPADYLAVWLAYCDYFRRQTHQDHTHQDLLDLFVRGRSKLMKEFGKQGDPKDTLSRYHANIVKDVAEGRAIFDDIMTRHGKEAGYWMDYITYVRHREGAENCRKLFLKAVNSVTDDAGRVCEGFLQFEREEGTLESYEAALSRTAAQMERLRERQEKAAEKEAQAKEGLKVKRKSEKKGFGDTQPDSARSQGSKRKRSAVHAFLKESDEEGGQEGAGEREANTAKKLRVEQDGDHFSEVGIAPSAAAADDLQTASEGATKDGVSHSLPMETDMAGETEEKRVGPEVEGPKEQRTVFVSNLPSAVTKGRLRERFAECGEIVEVRLVHSRAKFNRTNTFAYIEFSSPAPVNDALSLDHTLFMEKSIYVSPFKERGRKEPGKQSAGAVADDQKSDRVTKCTVYVNNMQRDITDQELQELFTQCGEVKQVRLVKNQQGRSKGYAYVEFLAESSARKAVQKLDSHSMGFKNIGVAMSNPPGNKAAETSTADSGGVARGMAGKTSFMPSRVMDEIEVLPPTRKSKISLLPRVLAKKGGAKGDDAAGGDGGDGGDKKEAVVAKSNKDFRKLFMQS